MNQIRCARYARYSTDRQNSLSIEDQLRKCGEFAECQGWLVLEKHTFVDMAVSGTTDDRKGLKHLLEAATAPIKQFDLILVDDTSRLSRRLADSLRIFEQLRFAGVGMYFVSQGIDTRSEQAEVLLATHGIVDSLYIHELGKKVHRGMEGLALRGFHTGGRCFGYRRVPIEDRTRTDTYGRPKIVGVMLEIEPMEASTVRRIFTEYTAGHSIKTIAKKLNREGVRSPLPYRGQPHPSWSPSALSVILHNDRYRGVVIWNKTRKERNPKTGRRVQRARSNSEWKVIEAPHLRIVSDGLWEKVQQRFELVGSHYGAKSRPGLVSQWNAIGSPYLFSGILRCGVCGANITLVSGAGKHAYAKYGCPMHHLRGTCTNDLTERRERLEERLLHGLQEAVLRQEVVEYTLQRFESELKAKLESLSGQAETLRSRRQSLELEIKHLTDALAAGNAPQPPAAVIAAIHERERELLGITDQLLEANPDSLGARLQDLRQFVISRLADVRKLLYADVSTAKAEIQRHVDKIDLVPAEASGERFFVASGEWDLLGGRFSRRSGGAGGLGTTERLPVVFGWLAAA